MGLIRTMSLEGFCADQSISASLEVLFSRVSQTPVPVDLGVLVRALVSFTRCLLVKCLRQTGGTCDWQPPLHSMPQ